jgi:hypothetical protein
MPSVFSAEPHGLDGARPLRPRRGEVESYGGGRTCSSDDCTTVLSRYNKDQRCWTHAADRADGHASRS